MVNALILAGEESDGGKLGARVKAAVHIHKKAMIEYIVDAMRQCGSINKILVVGPYEQLKGILGDRVDGIVGDQGSIIRNVTAGVNSFKTEDDIVICTCDIPMITVECINDFITASQRLQADFCYPIINKELNEKKFPGIVRTYTKIKEGTFTGGNMFYIRPHVVNKCCKKAEELILYRKNALKMAKVLGWKILFLLFTGKLTIPEAEKKFREIFGIKAKAIISGYPEIANDVDKPSDLEFVKNYLQI